jgi:hypothetical protein
MDFSSEVLIDFGLNLAGYLLVGLLIYFLLGRRDRQVLRPAATESTAAVSQKTNPAVKKSAAAVIGSDPEFIPLSGSNQVSPNRSNGDSSSAGRKTDRVLPITPATRQENRRAIYQEARRLLASGKPRGDLLRQLPLTEGELEMLSVTGKA